ncbi:MAG: hypothetical protein AB3A66_24095 [Nodularia sp. CChRGM 3473]
MKDEFGWGFRPHPNKFRQIKDFAALLKTLLPLKKEVLLESEVRRKIGGGH